jgi:hypothetical protein
LLIEHSEKVGQPVCRCFEPRDGARPARKEPATREMLHARIDFDGQEGERRIWLAVTAKVMV